jgi:signal transduction histidine kinase
VWDEPRPPDPPRRTWRDWALVAAFALSAVLEVLLRKHLPWPGLSLVLTLLVLPTLLWRRSHPLIMFAIGFVPTAVAPLFTHGQPLDMYSMAFLLVLPYALMRWGSGREALAGGAIVLGKVVFWLSAGFTGPSKGAGEVAILGAVMALGAALRMRARSRSRALDRVKLLERERLARELHDTVAHHVSAVAIRAQAGLALAEAQPTAAADALRVIEGEASRALAEMRTLVRLLRDDEPVDLTPGPRIADVARLASSPRTGPAVDVVIDGDVGELPAQLGAAVYRLAQESVTNARRHARHATRIEVRVSADETSVRLRVSDDGDPAHPRASGGYGLIGMRERAGLLGGVCEAGPGPTRGWVVDAVLPRELARD